MDLTKKDLSALAELFRQFWDESSAIENMAVMFERLSNDPNYVLLAAKQDDMLVGFCMGIVCQTLYGDCSPFMVIEDFIIDKEHRRTGIGTALMPAAEQHAIRRSCSQVIFVTENNRMGAHRFYASQGYSPVTHKCFKKRLNGQQSSALDCDPAALHGNQ